jgi:hypothetical protein
MSRVPDGYLIPADELDRAAYLLHFDEPIGDLSNPRGQAQHYLGSSDDVPARLADHAAGHGARLTQVVKERGIGWRLVRTWPGGRAVERALKDLHAGRQLCPECTAHPRPTRKISAVAEPRETRPAAPVRPRSFAAERGTRMADFQVGPRILAGHSADQVQAAVDYITAPFYDAEMKHTADQIAEHSAFLAQAAELIAMVRKEETTREEEAREAEKTNDSQRRNAERTEREERPMSLTTVQPATGWQKGALTAHQITVAQVEAGMSPDAVQVKQETAVAEYDPETATAEQQEWVRGYRETAADLLQTYRDAERAAAELPDREAEAG